MSKASYACVVVVACLTACRTSRTDSPGTATAPELTAPADAEHSADGLASKRLQAGTGTAHPEPQDFVEIHYTGWGSDGKVLDSSIPRDAPSQFALGSAIKGWSEGIALMVAGEKRRLWVPEALAYGDKPQDRVPRGLLVFDIELIKIIKKPRPPEAPSASDLAGPPLDAARTTSGLAYRVVVPGTGKQHPATGDTVEVNYSGWTPDGQLFDSTAVRQQSAFFRIGAPGMIDGWNEALAQLVTGEKARFWIPADLGYGKKVLGGPVGPLVFDVEMLALR